MSETGPKIERYDVLVVSQNHAFNMVEQGMKALINYLAASNIMRPNDEAIARDWVEVYGGPGPTAHEGFTRGAFNSDLEPFYEVAVRGGTKIVKMPHGGSENEGVYFYIEFRGSLWKDLAPKFKMRLQKILFTRVDVYSRPHTALPKHAEVPDDELPDEKKFAKADRTQSRIGTAVEEF